VAPFGTAVNVGFGRRSVFREVCGSVDFGYLPGAVRWRFSRCVLDGDARLLRREGRAVPLSPKAFELLVLLLAARPRALAQAELRDALWPGTHVGYTSLARVVSEARKAVGDTARSPALIRTVPRFGYAFAGMAASEDAEAGPAVACALVGRDREYPLPEGETVIGRGHQCGLRIASDQVSRVHARVRVEPGAVTLEDLGSKNGTRVNGKKLTGPATIADGDEVCLGSWRAVFRRTAGDDPTRSGSIG